LKSTWSNARHLKNVTGKKTDILDCQWIQQLHTYGLLRASFRPPEEICAVRALVRHRHSMIESSSREIQHMQKALQQMNIKLTNVISDLTGETGMKIIRDIVAGERNPHRLAHHRNNHCAKSEDEIAEALRGHYKPEHVFVLRQAVETYDFFRQQIRGVRCRTGEAICRLRGPSGLDPKSRCLRPSMRPASQAAIRRNSTCGSTSTK